ncbi:MAG: hypothetical protein WCQ50_09825, partial [Spirochaetota bacterium]
FAGDGFQVLRHAVGGGAEGIGSFLLRFSGEASEAKELLEKLLDELGQPYRFLGYALDTGADKAGEPRTRRRLRYELQDSEEGSILARTGRLEEEATARGWKVRIRKA